MIRKLILQPSAKQDLLKAISQCPDLETGGVLVGRYTNGDLVVERASGPGPNAIHSLIEFEMDKVFTDAFIEREYEDSAGMNVYAGEWHTHPQEIPQPSPQDWQSIGERSFEWPYGELVFVIIGFYELTLETMADQLIALMFDKSDEKLYRIPVEFVEEPKF